MELRSTFQKGIIWQIGHGNTTKFWISNWAHDTLLIEMFNLPNEIDKEEKMEKYVNIDRT